MNGEMVLLRVADESLEGWNWMPLDEFLERIDLNLWKAEQELVGVVLPSSQKKVSH
jgi:hypothetical protein